MGNPFRPYTPKQIKEYVQNLRAQNASLRNQLADSEAEVAALKADSDYVKGDIYIQHFKNATPDQIRIQIGWDNMSQDEKDRWLLLLRLLKAMVLSSYE